MDYSDRLQREGQALDDALGTLDGPLRLVVTGGRDYADEAQLSGLLDAIRVEWGVHELAQGGARGADALAKRWAHGRRVPCTTYAADWERHGKRAGPVRNGEMLREFRPDAVLAVAGGRGTADCIRQAAKAGIPIVDLRQCD